MSLNPDQFPVVREDNTVRSIVGSRITPQRYSDFVAVDPETKNAVGTVRYYNERWKTRDGGDFDRIKDDPTVRPGTDIPMFEHVPAKVDHFAVLPHLQGTGVSDHLLNHLAEHHWGLEGREVGSIPEPSEDLTPASERVAEKYTGRQPTGEYWIDQDFDPEDYDVEDYDTDYLDVDDESEYKSALKVHRDEQMRRFALGAVTSENPTARAWRPDAQPGEVLYKNESIGEQGVVSPTPKTSFEEKKAAVKARDEAAKPPRELSNFEKKLEAARNPNPQMRLPGTDPRNPFG